MHIQISIAIISSQTYMYLVIWVHITVYLSIDSPLTTRIAAKQSKERDSPVVAILDQTINRLWMYYTLHVEVHGFLTLYIYVE